MMIQQKSIFQSLYVFKGFSELGDIFTDQEQVVSSFSNYSESKNNLIT